MYVTKELRLSVFLVSGLLMMVGCFSSTITNQSATAQTKQTDGKQNNNQTEKPEILKEIDICSQVGAASEITPEDKNPDYRLFRLVNYGYPKEISIDEAVDVFNIYAQCGSIGKTQPPLRKEEIIASIRAWRCDSEADFDDRKKACAEFRKIADTGMMPKGAFIDAGNTSVFNQLGYDVHIWQINLQIRLDKYPDKLLKDVPFFYRVLRLNYVSSKPTENKPSH